MQRLKSSEISIGYGIVKKPNQELHELEKNTIDQRIIAEWYSPPLGTHETPEKTEARKLLKRYEDVKRKVEAFTNLIYKDLDEQLVRGELIARGFREPFSHGAPYLTISRHEWRIIKLGPPDRAEGGGVSYVGLTIGKVGTSHSFGDATGEIRARPAYDARRRRRCPTPAHRLVQSLPASGRARPRPDGCSVRRARHARSGLVLRCGSCNSRSRCVSQRERAMHKTSQIFQILMIGASVLAAFFWVISAGPAQFNLDTIQDELQAAAYYNKIAAYFAAAAALSQAVAAGFAHISQRGEGPLTR
jgi:hypothetical protein